MDEIKHVPVLLDEVIEGLNCKNDGIYVDGTLGYGGHSESILERCGTNGVLLGMDRDQDALLFSKKRLERFGSRAILLEGSYADIPQKLQECKISKVDGILLDLGVSSAQLDSPERGFSFRFEGPLDMRMGDGLDETAEDMVNGYEEELLADIFYYYGEERKSRRVASAIVAARQKERIVTTSALADIVKRATGYKKGRTHPATRSFQGLRIAVNKELDQLEAFCDFAFDILNEGGRVCIISYHSLEDRIVKQKFKKWKTESDYTINLINKKPITPGEIEINSNRRARSAKLRIAEKQ